MDTDSTTRKVSDVAIGTHSETSRQLFNADELKSVINAIDLGCSTGSDSGRKVKSVKTPSGMQNAIFLTDGDEPHVLKPESLQFLLNYPLPEPGYCWGPRASTVDGSGVFSPNFSLRTLTQMKYVNFYHCAVVFKLICRAPLPSSQSFWVSRQFNPASQYKSEVGFTWMPSRQPEVFVVLPWADFVHVSEVNAITAEVFGYLSVQPLSSLITEAGTGTPLEVYAYSAPLDMTLLDPKPITVDDLPAISYHSQSITFPTEAVDSYALDLEVTSPCWFAQQNFSIGPTAWAYDSANTVTITSILSNYDVSTGNLAYTQTPTFLTPGSYTVTLAYPSRDASNGLSVAFMSFSLFSGPVFTITPPAIASGLAPTIKDIPVGFKPAEDDNNVFVNPKFFEFLLAKDSRVTEPVSQLTSSFLTLGHELTFKSKVISQNPSDILVSAFAGGVEIAVMHYSSFKGGKRMICLALLHHVPLLGTQPNQPKPPSSSIGELQMYEFKYSGNNKVFEDVYGYQGDSSIREDSHWYQFNSIPISASTVGNVFNITLDLNTSSQSEASPTYVREYARHLLKGGYPNIKIQTVKNPYSSMQLRVTNGHQSTVQESLQMPGIEWDPSKEDVKFQPYWNNITPGVSDMKVRFTVTSLAHNISDSGFELVLFVNVSPIKFCHYRDYSFNAPTLRSRKLLSFPKGELQVSEETSLEGESKTPEENTAVVGVPKQITSIGSVPTERKYHFSQYIEADLSTARYIAINLCHQNFTKYEVTTAKRYRRYHGVPYVKVTMNTNFTMAGVCYVAHVDSGLDLTSTGVKPDDIIRMYPTGKTLVQGGSVELPVNWRSPYPFLPVLYGIDYPSLGQLIIVFPTATVATAAGDSKVKISIEFDLSNVVYSSPALVYPDYAYSGALSTVYDR